MKANRKGKVLKQAMHKGKNSISFSQADVQDIVLKVRKAVMCRKK